MGSDNQFRNGFFSDRVHSGRYKASRNRVCSVSTMLRPRHALIGDGLRRPSAAAYARTRVGKCGGRGSCQSTSFWHDAASSRLYGLQLFAALCCNALSGLRSGVELAVLWILRFPATTRVRVANYFNHRLTCPTALAGTLIFTTSSDHFSPRMLRSKAVLNQISRKAYGICSSFL